MVVGAEEFFLAEHVVDGIYFVGGKFRINPSDSNLSNFTYLLNTHIMINRGVGLRLRCLRGETPNYEQLGS